MIGKNLLLKLAKWVFTVLIIASCSKKVDNTVKTITIKTFDPSVVDFVSATSGGLITSPGDLHRSGSEFLGQSDRKGENISCT